MTIHHHARLLLTYRHLSDPASQPARTADIEVPIILYVAPTLTFDDEDEDEELLDEDVPAKAVEPPSYEAEDEVDGPPAYADESEGVRRRRTQHHSAEEARGALNPEQFKSPVMVHAREATEATAGVGGSGDARVEEKGFNTVSMGSAAVVLLFFTNVSVTFFLNIPIGRRWWTHNWKPLTDAESGVERSRSISASQPPASFHSLSPALLSQLPAHPSLSPLVPPPS
ncbi:hypothetical protein BDK51DRAFT_31345 [Blyttiomyces helicus]|uniref:Uncharacterized protein n=1 Tax=Blyttiomyces helicus TaxID=388810 RepID=A0A4P9WI24_9FUNG|nr:hypothetical protein BDK51DRAFT_31345 [Blyttiomyces helicus]|eukprot:RKO90770.1 hypothetical protein BDK51DRAFT_31345 [Blyttiomyces helicus]